MIIAIAWKIILYLIIKLLLDLLYSPPLPIVITPHIKTPKTISREITNIELVSKSFIKNNLSKFVIISQETCFNCVIH